MRDLFIQAGGDQLRVGIGQGSSRLVGTGLFDLLRNVTFSAPTGSVQFLNGMNKDQVLASFGEPTTKYEPPADSYPDNPLLSPEMNAKMRQQVGSISSWSWQGDTDGQTIGNTRHYERYSFGTVQFKDGVVYAFSKR